MKTKSFTRIGTLALSLLLALAVFMAAVPQSVQAAPAAATSCRTYHTVTEKDTTARIAHLYGLKWSEIAKANNIKTPYELTVGEKLCIPYPETTTTSTPPSTTGSNYKLVVTIVGNRVFVDTNSFAQKNNYTVKARDANASVGGWYKLGNMHVAKTTKERNIFSLPEELRKTALIQVCFKNRTTDELLCRNAVNQ